MKRTKIWLVAFLGFCLALLPGAARAAAEAEALLDLLQEEKVITADQAEKMKKKLAKIQEEKKLEVAKIEKAKEPDWKAFWKDGLNIQSKDGKNKIKAGGRIQVDFANISSPRRSFVDQLEAEQGNNLVGTGSEFRRARLFVEGTVYKIVQFKAEYDFTGGNVAFNDVWLGLKDVPGVGHIRIGHQKEPFSLEQLTSTRFTTFMERGLPDVFVPARNTGIRLHNTALKSKRLWWGVGVFQNADDFGNEFNNYQDWNITARVAGTPFYQDEGRKLLHLGFGYSHQFRNADQFELRYRQRPEAHITDVRPLDTTAGGTPRINANGIDLINPEIALVWGPFSLQGEYIWSFVNASRQYNPFDPATNQNLFLKGSNPTFHGGYIYASFFLTGENRNYVLSDAAFGRVKPKRNFDLEGGWGAWEVAFRYSYLNLNSRVSSDPVPPAPGVARVGVRGGIENNYTVGVNWYPTPNTRWMLNYIYADIDNVRVIPLLPPYNTDFNKGPLHIVQTRFMIDF